MNTMNTLSGGFLSMTLGQNGTHFAISSAGTDISLGTLYSNAMGIGHIVENSKIESYTQAHGQENLATSLRIQYGYGDKESNTLLDEILSGKTKLSLTSEKKDGATAQTTTDANGNKTVTLYGITADMSIEDMFKAGLVLQHEAHRDGLDNGEVGQLKETVEAVLAHSNMAIKILDDELYAGALLSLISQDSNLKKDMEAFFAYEKSGSDKDAFAEFMSYVDGNYDSSADYWKFTKDGNIVWDGSKNLYDEDGNLLHEYKGKGGNTAALAKCLGITEAEAEQMLKKAGYTWDGDKHTFVDKNGKDVKDDITKAAITSDAVKDAYASEKGILSTMERLAEKLKNDLSQTVRDCLKKLSVLINSLNPTYQELNKKYEEVAGKAYADEDSLAEMQKYDANGVPTSASQGFNCIGFVCYMLGLAPNYSVADFDKYDQFELVPGVDKDDPLKNAKVGDVLRFVGTTNEDKPNNHVMIYAGNGYVWECTPGRVETGQGVRYQRFVNQANYYKLNFRTYDFSIYRRKR